MREVQDLRRSIGFPPVAAPDARILILGSMPGRMSLEKQQYYAQPRNAFWRIMGELFGAGPELPYSDRLKVLVAERVALWDVLRSCERPGSLDSAIDVASAVPNDFGGFMRGHPQIRQICFNGATAASLFRRKVSPDISAVLDGMSLVTLPSTSPAHAALGFEGKLCAWRHLR
jgi:hypoxanthine-DNA glycosylase